MAAQKWDKDVPEGQIAAHRFGVDVGNHRNRYGEGPQHVSDGGLSIRSQRNGRRQCAMKRSIMDCQASSDQAPRDDTALWMAMFTNKFNLFQMLQNCI